MLVILGQHSPLARFCSDFDGEISTKGFWLLCMYETANVNNNYRRNNSTIDLLSWQYYRQMYQCLLNGNYGMRLLSIMYLCNTCVLQNYLACEASLEIPHKHPINHSLTMARSRQHLDRTSFEKKALRHTG